MRRLVFLLAVFVLLAATATAVSGGANRVEARWVSGLLEPEHRETVIGHAEVKQVFQLSRGIVAGCLVVDGRISRTARARVVRRRQPVYDGGISTLRRFQDDVKEVRSGLECGIKLGDFSEYQVGDVIECYQLEQVPQKL